MQQTTISANRKPYIEYYLPFYSVLAFYKIGPLPASTIGLIIVLLLVARNNHGIVKIKKNSWYLVFFAYIVLRDVLRFLIGYDDIQTQLNRLIEYVIVFLVVLAICSEGFNEDKLYKSWKIAGLIFSIGLIYQLFQIYVLGQRVTPISIIPGYDIRPNGIALLVSRPSSFFAEPASFVNAMIPLEFMALRRKEFKIATVVSLIIISSTSTVGIVLSAILWWTALWRKEAKAKTKVISILSIIVIIYVFSNFSIFDSSASKLLQVAEGGSTFGSRVITSFEIVHAENLVQKIIGTEYNDVNSFISQHSSQFSSDSVVNMYWNGGRGNVFLNTFGQLMLRYGIVGLILFLMPLLQYLKSSTYQAKPFVIMVIAAIFGQSMLLNSYYFMVIMILILYEHYKKV